MLGKVFLISVFLYSCAGSIFGIFFVWVGVKRIDAIAANSGLLFRLTILPGVILLWPYLLLRWTGRARPGERERHRRLAILAHGPEHEGHT